MNIKKKMAMGTLAAALGLSLIGAGTWAAFNDVEQTKASIAAGKLDLRVVPLSELSTATHLIDVSNLKPGDTMEREFRLINDGTLAIKDVLMSVEFDGFTNQADANYEYPQSIVDGGIEQNTDALEFLSQFQVEIMRVGNEGDGAGNFPNEIISAGDGVTLADIYYATTLDVVDAAARNAAQNKLTGAVHGSYWTDNRINVATINPDEWTGLPVNPVDPDDVLIKVKFIDSEERNDVGLYLQNAFQNNAIDVYFELEARQWAGIEVQDGDIGDGVKGSGADGYIQNNERANSGRPINTP